MNTPNLIIFLINIMIFFYIGYYDIKYGIIKNRNIAILLSFNLFYKLITTGKNNIPIHFIILYYLEIFLLSIILYKFQIWAAGDSKLFISIIFCVPIYLIKTNIFIFPIQLIIVSLIFAYIYLLLISIKSTTKIKFKATITQFKQNCIEYFCFYFYFISLDILTQNFIKNLNIQSFIRYFFLIIIIKFLFAKFEILKSKHILPFIIIIASFLIFHNNRIIQTVKTISIFLILLFSKDLIKQNIEKTISTSQLKEKMILSEKSYYLLCKKKILKFNIDSFLRNSSHKISSEDINRIKKYSDKNEEFVIIKKIPFALFLFLGLFKTMIY